MRNPALLAPWLAFAASCSSQTDFSGSSGHEARRPAPAEAPSEAAPPATAQSGDAVGAWTIEQSFPAARVEPVTARLEPEYRTATQAVTLHEQAPAVQTFRQIERALVREAFTQGHDGATATPESFQVTASGKLDLLVVVDNSTSMQEEQANLASKLDPLLSRIGDTDWQIAVVTTSSPCLRKGRLIKKSDADAKAAFAAAVVPPLDNTVVEKGFPTAIRALKGECNATTTPWVRAGSAVAVLILSDEDNCGSNAGEGCPGELGETPEQMVDYLRSIRSAAEARIYGLFEGPLNECGTAAWTATKYKQGVDATGGTWGSICDADYTATLQKISDNVSKIVKREFKLAHVPDAGSLRLELDGMELQSGYAISGNVVTIDPAVSGRTLVARYVYGATPKYDAWKLAEAPDPDTIAVTIGGKAVAAGGYDFDADSGRLVFVDMPDDDAQIAVAYRRPDLLPDRFELGDVHLLGMPTVTVNGETIEDVKLDTTELPAIILAEAPLDGAQVRVAYRTPEGRIVDYPASIDQPEAALAVAAHDAATGADVLVEVRDDRLVFGPDEVWEGRAVAVVYELGYADQALRVQLTQDPIEGSVKATAQRLADACSDGLTVEGRVVTLACPDFDVGAVTLTYAVVAEVRTSFAMPGQIPEDAEWHVLVDGVETRGFTRAGQVVSLPAGSLAPASTVTLKVVTRG
jgi:hypothetical protein